MGESLEYLRSRDLNAAEKYLRRVQLRNSLTTDLLSLSTKSGAIRSLSPGCNLMNWKYTEVHFSFYWPAQTKSKIRRNMRGPPCTGALYNNLSLSKSFSTKTQYHPDDGNFQHFKLQHMWAALFKENTFPNRILFYKCQLVQSRDDEQSRASLSVRFTAKNGNHAAKM